MTTIERKIPTISNSLRQKIYFRIATINVRTLQEDLKLAIIVKAARYLNIDILTMQEVRRTGSGVFEFNDK